MSDVKLGDIKKTLSYLSLDELLELEVTLKQIIQFKTRNQNTDEWKKDFLRISEWNHLDKHEEVKVTKWKIKTF